MAIGQLVGQRESARRYGELRWNLHSAIRRAVAPPVLNICLSGQQVFLTWLTNAAGFNLQQNTNLLTTNWVTVTNIPVITNILYQVTVSKTNSQHFYRLETP